MKKLDKGKNAKVLAKDIFYLLLPYKNFARLIIRTREASFMNINPSPKI
jgi:hypothetical protein